MSAGRQASATPRPGVHSIRLIVSATAALLVALSVGGAGMMFEQQARRALTHEIDSRLLLEARHLALTSSRALLSEYPELTLQPVVREMMSGERGIIEVVVLDHRGWVAAHPDARALGRPYSPLAGLHGIPPTGVLAPGESLRGDRSRLVASAPVPGAAGGTIGMAIVGLRRDVADRALAEARRQQLALLGVFVLVGVIASWLLVSQLLRPVGALRQGIERIGSGTLDQPIPVQDRTELGLLAGAINHMTVDLQRAQVQMLERERLSHEIELARELQCSLLPKQAYQRGPFRVVGAQRAATEVGGDYWDVFDLPNGRAGIVLADVAGKGLAGCLVMSMLSALLRAYCGLHTSPAAVLGAIHDRLCESLQPGMFVTIFYGTLDPATGELTYCSAGHHPALVWRQRERGLERLSASGAPLASIRDARFRSTLVDRRVVLGTGDLLVQYTDGYTEAFRAGNGEQFGIRRFEELLERLAADGPAAIMSGLPRAVAEWRNDGPASDDETLLVVTRSDSTPEQQPGDLLERLSRAEAAGLGIQLGSSLPAVAPMRDWVRSLPGVRDMEPGERELLVTGLYEVCANVCEHGYRDMPTGEFELWWLPETDGHARLLSETASPDPGTAGAIVRRGVFILRDDGVPFTSEQWAASDFGDPAVRLRGRGFGLDIIHRMMREVAYQPATARGNVTLLAFDPPARRSSRPGAAA